MNEKCEKMIHFSSQTRIKFNFWALKYCSRVNSTNPHDNNCGVVVCCLIIQYFRVRLHLLTREILNREKNQKNYKRRSNAPIFLLAQFTDVGTKIPLHWYCPSPSRSGHRLLCAGPTKMTASKLTKQSVYRV